jgi:hypothetical protein
MAAKCERGCGEMGACHPNREDLVAAVRRFLAKYEGNKAAQLGNGAARRFFDEARLILGES